MNEEELLASPQLLLQQPVMVHCVENVSIGYVIFSLKYIPMNKPLITTGGIRVVRNSEHLVTVGDKIMTIPIEKHVIFQENIILTTPISPDNQRSPDSTTINVHIANNENKSPSNNINTLKKRKNTAFSQMHEALRMQMQWESPFSGRERKENTEGNIPKTEINTETTIQVKEPDGTNSLEILLPPQFNKEDLMMAEEHFQVMKEETKMDPVKGFLEEHPIKSEEILKEDHLETELEGKGLLDHSETKVEDSDLLFDRPTIILKGDEESHNERGGIEVVTA